jgi:hypothetical protein
MVPIIIPINNTRKVDCIIQDGVKYCERSDIPISVLGFLILGILCYIAWVWFWLGKMFDYNVDGWVGGFMIALPWIILAILMIII